MKELEEALTKLAGSLEIIDLRAANYVRNIQGKSPQEIADDLSLWGGAGSIMDIDASEHPRDIQRAFENSFINLGQVLLDAGFKNPRMESWVNTFKKWSNENV